MTSFTNRMYLSQNASLIWIWCSGTSVSFFFSITSSLLHAPVICNIKRLIKSKCLFSVYLHFIHIFCFILKCFYFFLLFWLISVSFLFIYTILIAIIKVCYFSFVSIYSFIFTLFSHVFFLFLSFCFFAQLYYFLNRLTMYKLHK